MIPSEIISEVSKSGVTIQLLNGKLSVHPASKLSNDLINEIKANRDAVIRYMTDQMEWNAGRAWEELAGRQWVAVKSAALGGAEILWTARGDTQVPSNVKMLPRFSVREIEELCKTPDLIQAAYDSKVVFTKSTVDECRVTEKKEDPMTEIIETTTQHAVMRDSSGSVYAQGSPCWQIVYTCPECRERRIHETVYPWSCGEGLPPGREHAVERLLKFASKKVTPWCDRCQEHLDKQRKNNRQG